jgi:hypothetical protein
MAPGNIVRVKIARYIHECDTAKVGPVRKQPRDQKIMKRPVASLLQGLFRLYSRTNKAKKPNQGGSARIVEEAFVAIYVLSRSASSSSPGSAVLQKPF